MPSPFPALAEEVTGIGFILLYISTERALLHMNISPSLIQGKWEIPQFLGYVACSILFYIIQFFRLSVFICKFSFVSLSFVSFSIVRKKIIVLRTVSCRILMPQYCTCHEQRHTLTGLHLAHLEPPAALFYALRPPTCYNDSSVTT